MKAFALSLLLVMVAGICFGQELKVAPVIGPNVNFGLLSQDAKDHYFENYYEDYGLTVRHKFPPAIRMQVGALADYSFSDMVSIQSGLLFNFRGFHLKLDADFTDEDGVQETFQGTSRTSVTYLEIPVWLNLRLGESGFKLSAGPNIGFALGGKETTTVTYDGRSETESERITVGNRPRVDKVKPFDLSINLGLTKEIELGERPLDITLFAQPSISKWNVTEPQNSSYYIRHFTAGIRAAYFFSVNN